jgi:hypothetical protein
METTNRFCADVYLDAGYVGNAYVDGLPICGEEITLETIDGDTIRNISGIVASVSFEEGKTEMVLKLESNIRRAARKFNDAATKFYDDMVERCEGLVNALKEFYQAIKEGKNGLQQGNSDRPSNERPGN